MATVDDAFDLHGLNSLLADETSTVFERVDYDYEFKKSVILMKFLIRLKEMLKAYLSYYHTPVKS